MKLYVKCFTGTIKFTRVMGKLELGAFLGHQILQETDGYLDDSLHAN